MMQGRASRDRAWLPQSNVLYALLTLLMAVGAMFTGVMCDTVVVETVRLCAICCRSHLSAEPNRCRQPSSHSETALKERLRRKERHAQYGPDALLMKE